jgi:hypothetical protein
MLRRRILWTSGAAALAACVAFAPSPAAAGFFEQLFGDLRHAFSRPEPPRVERYSDPLSSFARAIEPRTEREVRADRGPAQAFCVRSCDGHYFPVRAHAGMGAAQACHSFCPASETKLYSGGSIDYAFAADGSRYADMPNAFRYRKQLVSGCTCNGRTAFGLAQIDPRSDPTLRPGDIVATKGGLMAVTARRDFTPAASYAGFSRAERAALAKMRVTPEQGTPAGAATASVRAPSDAKSAALTK